MSDTAAHQETRRLETLHDLHLPGAALPGDVARLVAVAGCLTQCPVAGLLVGYDEFQRLEAAVGCVSASLSWEEGLPRELVFSGESTCVGDAAADPRLEHLPGLLGGRTPGFFACVPLAASNRAVLGVLLVADFRRRDPVPDPAPTLELLARQIIAQFELNRRVQQQSRTEAALLSILEDQRLAEQALRQREREQRELVAQIEAERARLADAQTVAKVGSWETNLETRQVIWSEQTHRIFETEPAIFRPTHDAFLERVHPEDRAAVDAAFMASIEAEGSHRIEHRIVLRDGRIRHVEERWRVSRAGPDVPARAVGTCQDITERKLAELERARLERRLSDMLEAIQDAFLTVDTDWQVTYSNREAERLLGRGAGGLSGKVLWEAIPSLAGTRVEAALRDVARTQSMFQVEEPLQGLNIRVEVRAFHSDWGLAVFVRDITEHHRLEQQFLRAQRMESIGTLAGGIAHDLNNLLSPILIGIDLLVEIGVRPELETIVDNMRRSALRGADLVRQVLTFARGVEGERVSVNLRHIVNEIGAIIANTFPKNVSFDSNLPRDLHTVSGDPTQLNQAILNLCVNARDAMPDGGRLSITGREVEVDKQFAVMNRGVAAGRYVVVEVADTGIGMSPEVQDRIFEPFFTTKPLGSGTGLGLSTTLAIIRSHGGFINVSSEVGRGTAFSLYLPVESGQGGASPAQQAASEVPRGAGEWLLVVDDETSILEVMKHSLEAFGYHVISAADGAQGMAAFVQNRERIACIVTDMMMPVMDGAALISAVRSLDPDLPIIATSGLATQGRIGRSASTNVEFLAKPYSAEALLRVMRRVLDARRVSGPS